MENLSISKEGFEDEKTPTNGNAIKSSSVNDDCSPKKNSRRAKGCEETRKQLVINHSNVKVDMAPEVCGRSKGLNAKCCNSNLCRQLFICRDAPEGLEDLALISTVLLLRAELFPNNGGVQVEKLKPHAFIFNIKIIFFRKGRRNY